MNDKISELNELLDRIKDLGLSPSYEKAIQEISIRLNKGTSIGIAKGNKIINFITNLVRRISVNKKDSKISTEELNEIETKIKSILSDVIEQRTFSKDFTKEDGEGLFIKDYEYQIREYTKKKLKIDVSDKSIKLYDISLDSKVYEEIKRRIVQEEVEQFIAGKDLETIKQGLKEYFIEQNNNLTKRFKETPTIEPYYGEISFMSKRVELIKNAMIKMLEHPDFADRKDIQEYIKFCESFENINDNEQEMSIEAQKQKYVKYEKFYIKVLEIEDTLAKDVEKVWEKSFTKTDQISKYGAGEIITLDKILENGKMGFFAHWLSGELVNPKDMNKICCTFNTEKAVTALGKVGLIYPMNMKNVLTVSPTDACSWVTNKDKFIENGFPTNWQYTEPIDKDGNRMWFENPPTFTKLFLPDYIENESIANSIKFNGEMLNNNNFNSYNETILLNKDGDMLPIAVFMITEGKPNDEILESAKKLSEFYNLPILDIDINYLRELQGMKPLPEKARENNER